MSKLDIFIAELQKDRDTLRDHAHRREVLAASYKAGVAGAYLTEAERLREAEQMRNMADYEHIQADYADYILVLAESVAKGV
jgi:hypothetical protein